ncbi:MAG: hypothetical protein P0Y53_03060 [Candidatus Pseudobacter hemicellulosilyticus]|uniref:Uncharacterized protein n=1 Tax=Candidatus Pseudobacter hemicellulosilyticus TaxID=3121375 RepID=A0AAJ6BGS7_9BACT|nr:MAG: hypothetical protein P0Y53_03060 [Pseudobacter sp.]
MVADNEFTWAYYQYKDAVRASLEYRCGNLPPSLFDQLFESAYTDGLTKFLSVVRSAYSPERQAAFVRKIVTNKFWDELRTHKGLQEEPFDPDFHLQEEPVIAETIPFFAEFLRQEVDRIGVVEMEQLQGEMLDKATHLLNDVLPLIRSQYWACMKPGELLTVEGPDEPGSELYFSSTLSSNGTTEIHRISNWLQAAP